MFNSIVSRSAVLAPARSFSTSFAAGKSLTDTVKETADTINKKVGQTLASGIGAAQEAGNTASAQTNEKAADAADNAAIGAQALKEDVNQKTAQVVGKAKDVKDAAQS